MRKEPRGKFDLLSKNSIATIIIVTVIILAIAGLVSYYESSAYSTNPDNSESVTRCIYPLTTSTMTYYIGTSPLCLASVAGKFSMTDSQIDSLASKFFN